MKEKPHPDMSFEMEARASGFLCVAGVDEAGRGPLAGPVCAAAVILPLVEFSKTKVPRLTRMTASPSPPLFSTVSSARPAALRSAAFLPGIA